MPAAGSSNTLASIDKALLESTPPFATLSDKELAALSGLLTRRRYPRDEPVFIEGTKGSVVYLVEKGELSLERVGRRVHVYRRGDIFGEVAALDEKARTGTVRALDDSVLLELSGPDLLDGERIDPAIAIKIVHAFGRRVASYVRESTSFYDQLDVLLVQDGGCAPGYNPATAFLCHYLEAASRQVFVCAEGFRSLVRGRAEDFRCLIHDPKLFAQFEHIPGVLNTVSLREGRGADFRCERFPDFKEPGVQDEATRNAVDRGVRVLIGIGGNGTFAGIKALSRRLPDSTQVFFVPVTIDSDIKGTECIGQHTGVEVGAEKVRAYMADARTHHRCYVIEMMGAEGGYHALNSCLGAGADLAVLPGSTYDLRQIAAALRHRTSAVIVVAEGYQRDARKQNGYIGNAAEYFRDELLAAGLDIPNRIICEGFSRDIRGAAPNNIDIALAQRMARQVADLVLAGRSHLMPAVEADRVSAIPFDEVRTDNAVLSDLAELANKLAADKIPTNVEEV